jgi:hypothetical protein
MFSLPGGAGRRVRQVTLDRGTRGWPPGYHGGVLDQP